MENFVSTRWIGVAALVASMSVAWAIFIPYRFPWMGLVLVTVAVSGALWVRLRSPRSVSEMIDDIEAEPVAVTARAPKPIL